MSSPSTSPDTSSSAPGAARRDPEGPGECAGGPRSLGGLNRPEDWERYWAGRKLAASYPLYPVFKPTLPSRPGASFLEIGCAPGRILGEICLDQGYQAFGLDFAADPDEMAASLQARGVDVGGVFKTDFMTWDPRRTFDVVASFGFIEHFADPGVMVDRHFRVVAPGGTVVVTVPHFAGMQRPLRWLLDRPNLRRHNLACMSLRFFREAAERNRAEIVLLRFAGGHFGFWTERDSQPPWARRVIRACTKVIKKVVKLLPGDSNPYLSPFLVAVYRAPSE